LEITKTCFRGNLLFVLCLLENLLRKALILAYISQIVFFLSITTNNIRIVVNVKFIL